MALYLAHPSSHEHETGSHPENPGRLRAVEEALADAGWLGMRRIEAPMASREQLTRVHTEAHLDALAELCARGGGMIDADTVTGERSFEAALHAAGGPVRATEMLLAGEDRVAFCGLRPPGHHAERERAMGFCLLGNVAVAAMHALEGGLARRVMVVDWDVHHGNGTEAAFWRDDRVLFTSIHQHPFYPGTGAIEDVGAGAGEGFTINLPVPAGSDGALFGALVGEVIVPAGRRFEPDLIMVSAGYDAHLDDPLGGCRLADEDYAAMASAVADLARGVGAPVCACLEGGYSPAALARSVLATIRGLGEPRPLAGVDAGLALPYAERLSGRWLG